MNWTAIFDVSARAHIPTHPSYADIILTHILENAERLMVWQVEAATALLEDPDPTEDDNALTLARRIDGICGFHYPVDETAHLIMQTVVNVDYPVRGMITRDIPTEDVVRMMPIDREGMLRIGMVLIDGIVSDVVRSIEFMGVWTANERIAPSERIDPRTPQRQQLAKALVTLVREQVFVTLGSQRIIAMSQLAGYQAEREFTTKTMH